MKGILTSEGLFDGTISTKTEEYYVEPVSRYLPLFSTKLKQTLNNSSVNNNVSVRSSSHNNSHNNLSNELNYPLPNFHSIVYKGSDVKKPITNTCASQNLYRKLKNSFDHYDVDERKSFLLKNRHLKPHRSRKHGKKRDKRWLMMFDDNLELSTKTVVNISNNKNSNDRETVYQFDNIESSSGTTSRDYNNNRIRFVKVGPNTTIIRSFNDKVLVGTGKSGVMTNDDLQNDASSNVGIDLTKTSGTSTAVNNGNNFHDDWLLSRQHIHKRAAIDPKKTTCMLYLQADHLFYQKYGTEEACIEVMTRHVQRVNSIYKVTGKLIFLNISLLLVII